MSNKEGLFKIKQRFENSSTHFEEMEVVELDTCFCCYLPSSFFLYVQSLFMTSMIMALHIFLFSL